MIATVAICFYTAQSTSSGSDEPDHRPKLAEQNSSPFSVCKDLDHSDPQTVSTGLKQIPLSPPAAWIA